MKTIFWNVDTQYDFMRSCGKLYVKGSEDIEDNLLKLTNLAYKQKIKVINTADWHNNHSEEISNYPDFIKKFPEHCMQNSNGAKFIPATNPINPYEISWAQKNFSKVEVLKNRNIVLYKDKFDIFEGSPHTEEIIKLLNPEKAVVYGVATNVCVDYAVFGLLERKIKVYVPTDAVKEIPNLSLPYQSWQEKGAILTTTQEICELFGEKK